MLLEITIFTLCLLTILTYTAYRSKNIIFQSLAFASFIILVPLYFGSFIITSGEPREIIWDLYFNKHMDKMRVISYVIDEKNKKIYLWLGREDNSPIYYIINDPEGKKSKKLREAATDAKKGKGSLYFIFEPGAPGKEKNDEKTKKFLGIEGTIHDDIFETISPHGPAPIKEDAPSEIINFNDSFGGEEFTPN